MSFRKISSPALFLTVCTMAAIAACADGPPTAPTLGATSHRAHSAVAADGRVALCHLADGRGTPIRVARAALATHVAHGDYKMEFFVDKQTVDDPETFGFIADAVAAARVIRLENGELTSAACRIAIHVSAGTFTESFPLVVDVPDVDLTGATLNDDPQSILRPAAPLEAIAEAARPLIIALGHPGGSAANGLTVSGFVFTSGHPDGDPKAAGLGFLAQRVRDIRVMGNRFGSAFGQSIDLRASTGEVASNQLGSPSVVGTSTACDICLAGPGDYVVRGNTLYSGGLVGINAVPTTVLPVFPGVEPFSPEAGPKLTASIENNVVVDHFRKPVGTGIRVNAVGPGATDLHGTTEVRIANNVLLNNGFGVIVDGGFPVPGSQSDIAVAFSGNRIEMSCQNALLVSLARHTTGLGLTNTPYLQNSTYAISLGGDLPWADVWFSHPAGFGNTLVVDGVEIANGARAFYNATKVCPPSGG